MPEAPPRQRVTRGALLLTNIGQLLTLRGGNLPRRGRELLELGLIGDAAVLCSAGKIISVGTMKDARRDSWIKTNRRSIQEVDCTGRVVLPGFVDSHTHPVFVAPRLVDFEKGVAGASYEEIAAAGGGIRSSIAAVRDASRKQLAEVIGGAFNRMLAQGTTTVEAKSGYGLNAEAELKSLEAIRDVAARWPGTVVPTLLGAHVVPPEFKADPKSYVSEVVNKMIPQAAERGLAQFVDIFCERGAFTSEDAEQIFETASRHGLGTRAHVCQLTAAALKPLLRFDPASLDHMDHVQEADIPILAKTNTVATLLPGANFFLGLMQYPEARKLIDNGVAVALATDYNPGTSPTTSMSFVLSLACTHMKMSPAEAIAAATINGACALRLQGRKGSIEPGKDADLAIFDVADYREIPYWIAANRCVGVVANGEVVVG